MTDFKKLRKWRGQTQVDFASDNGIEQGTLSRIENGKNAPSIPLTHRVIDYCTPTVLFIQRTEQSEGVATAMLRANQLDLLENDFDKFRAALKGGLRIGVITDDKTPYFQIIDKALLESGLKTIPCQGITYINGRWIQWLN